MRSWRSRRCACVSGDIVLTGNASVVAHNTTAKSQGGALCGQYAQQNLLLSDTASVDVIGSHAIDIRGGAIFAHNVTLSGASHIRLKETSSPCGAAIAVIDAQNLLGGGFVTVDGSSGASLFVVDARELNTTLGCVNIEGNLVDESAKVIPQPCSSCADPSFPPTHREACMCGNSAEMVVRECCTAGAHVGV